MVKCILILGILATNFASIFAAPANNEPRPHRNIKIFTPDLSSRSIVNIYATPVSVPATPKPQPASLSAGTNNDSALNSKINTAISYLNVKHSIPSDSIQVTSAYTDTSSGISHVYVRQVIKGLEVVNAVGGVNINRDGKVISASHAFAPASHDRQAQNSWAPLFAQPDAKASIKSAFRSLADYVETSIDSGALDNISISPLKSRADDASQFTISNIPKDIAVDGSASAKKSLIQNSDGSLTPVWSFTLEQKNDWWSAEVSATTGKVVSINNWYSRAESYNVYPRYLSSPFYGQRQAVNNPADTRASPKGWVTQETSVGNNAWVYSDRSGCTTMQAQYSPRAPGNVFNFPLDLRQQPPCYIDAAITQLFYTTNTMHDLSFLYGFDEAAGNFQQVNSSGRGRGNDGVIAIAQDTSGTNNAFFATPPDGQNPRMRMFIFTATNPYRDGGLDRDLVAHEYTHGISNRLTGGPANTNCLNQLESAGMGEGWSDTVTNLLRIRASDTRSLDIYFSEYATDRRFGRYYPYSTNMNTNPTTFEYLDTSRYQEVHAVGEVWASMLYEVIWNIIENNGKKISDLFAHDLTAGNSISLQIILDAMKLQPCNPNFLQARDFIFQADKYLTGGKNKCAIWKGFAKRGLGVNASESSSSHSENYDVPSDCK